MIKIDARHQGLIGDALCAVPYMKHLCDFHGTQAYAPGFCEAVRPLVQCYPFVFDDPVVPFVATYGLDLPAAWQENMHAGWPLHMSQIYFSHNRCAVPALPTCYPMHSEPCGLEPGIAITPFSRTNAPDNNKLWPHDRWLKVMQHFYMLGEQVFYVLGTSEDDFNQYAGIPGVKLVKDEPLPRVLDLLRTSKLVMGLDNGISHLAHVGGVHKHVMIYADCLPPRLAENPLGIHIRGRFPADIPFEAVVEAAAKVLGGQHDRL